MDEFEDDDFVTKPVKMVPLPHKPTFKPLMNFILDNSKGKENIKRRSKEKVNKNKSEVKSIPSFSNFMNESYQPIQSVKSLNLILDDEDHDQAEGHDVLSDRHTVEVIHLVQ